MELAQSTPKCSITPGNDPFPYILIKGFVMMMMKGYKRFCTIVGNLLLNLFGCGACINISQGTNAAPDIVLIALAFGLAVFAAVSVSTVRK